MCHRFEIIGYRRVTRLRELLDAGAATLQQRNGTKVAEHGQGAGDLLDRPIERRQVMALFRVAEETVKRLLDLRQVVLNFTCNLTDQQFFLGAPGHFVEQRQFFIAASRLAGDAGVQASNHEVDLLRKIHPETAEILLGILQQQNGGRDFHRHRIVVAPGILGEPGSQGGETLPQPLEIGMSDFIGQRRAALRVLIESRQGRGATGAELVPQLFGTRKRIAQAAQRNLLRHVGFALGDTGRHQGRQAEHRLHFGNQHAGIGWRPGHGVENVTHHAFSDGVRSFQQAANLRVNAGQQLSGFGICLAVPIEQRFDESQRRPPERTSCRGFLSRLDIVQRRPHVFEGDVRLGRMLHPGQ